MADFSVRTIGLNARWFVQYVKEAQRWQLTFVGGDSSATVHLEREEARDLAAALWEATEHGGPFPAS